MHERTAYQNGYEDAQDRGLFASGLPKHGESGEYHRGYRDGEEALKKQLPSSRIAALESQVKALTEERDQACRERADAQHRYTVAMHDISKACAGTTARSACEVVELWRKERDAQAEAVKSACRMAYRASYLGFDHAWGDSQISCIKNKIVRETMQDIARAAVERGAEG